MMSFPLMSSTDMGSKNCCHKEEDSEQAFSSGLFILGSLFYFSYYLGDNIFGDPLGGKLTLGVSQMLLVGPKNMKIGLSRSSV